MLLPFFQFLHAFSPFSWMFLRFQGSSMIEMPLSRLSQHWALTYTGHFRQLWISAITIPPLLKRTSLNKALLDARLWAWRWILTRQWKGASPLSKTKTVVSAYDFHSHEHLTRFTVGEQNSLLGSGASNLHRMRLVTPTMAVTLLTILSYLEPVQGRWEVRWEGQTSAFEGSV